jgi:hypothetical protein
MVIDSRQITFFVPGKILRLVKLIARTTTVYSILILRSSVFVESKPIIVCECSCLQLSAQTTDISQSWFGTNAMSLEATPRCKETAVLSHRQQELCKI